MPQKEYVGPSRWAELQKQYDPETLKSMITREGVKNRDIYLRGEETQQQAPPTSDLRSSISNVQRNIGFLESPSALIAQIKSSLQTRAEETAPLRKYETAIRERLYTPDLTPENLRYMSPEDQSKIRKMGRAGLEAEASTLSSMKKERGETIADILDSTKNIITEQRQAQEDSQKRMRDNIFNLAETGGSASFDRFTEEDIKTYEQGAGLPKGYFNAFLQGLKSTEAQKADRPLTPTEARMYGVPTGTRLSQVAGRTPQYAGSGGGGRTPTADLEGLTSYEWMTQEIAENTELSDSDLELALRAANKDKKLGLSISDISLAVKARREARESTEEEKIKMESIGIVIKAMQEAKKSDAEIETMIRAEGYDPSQFVGILSQGKETYNWWQKAGGKIPFVK